MTRGMKIKAMMDEELANLISESCPYDICIHDTDDKVMCQQCIREWLQSKAKE